MRTLSRITTLCLAATLLVASPAEAAKKLTLGLFVPNAIVGGDERFKAGEALAAALSESMGQPVVSKNFARFEDFQSAYNKGALDIALVDGWVSTALGEKLRPAAVADLGDGTSQRWALVGRQKALVKDLKSARLAVPKLTSINEKRFVANLVFEGDFDPKGLKFVSVPNVESALTSLEAKKTDVALVPAGSVPKDAHVLFRSRRLPTVVVLAAPGELQAVQAALKGLAPVAAFKRFSASPPQDLNALKRLLTKGPPPRLCVMADSPTVPLDSTALLDFGEVGRVLPSFTRFLEVPAEQPDP